jgi:hypothetical protein
MKRVIFYSWQSDTKPKTNRNFIENALKSAILKLAQDQGTSIEPVLDRDTFGMSGSPDIVDTILAKVSAADLFVADVTLCVVNGAGRSSPNPNVLVELGYAIAQLGWDRILLVQNVVHGGPEMLPFDLRGRRIMTYAYGEDAPNLANIKSEFVARLDVGLRTIFELFADGMNSLSKPVSRWWGKWVFGAHKSTFGGELFIREVGTGCFFFDLSVFNGAHSGQVSGYATISAKNVAYSKIPNGNSSGDGEVRFRKHDYAGKTFLEIEETISCSYFHGAAVAFSGTFELVGLNLSDYCNLNEIQLSRLHDLLKAHFDSFNENFHVVGEADCEDEGLSCRVITGGVTGLFTIRESILMIEPQGRIWAAYIKGNQVNYFSNDSNSGQNVPQTIENWRGRFPEKKFVRRR